MAKTKERRCRLSVDVNLEEHSKIKMSAAIHNLTIRRYVVEAIRERFTPGFRATRVIGYVFAGRSSFSRIVGQ